MNAKNNFATFRIFSRSFAFFFRPYASPILGVVAIGLIIMASLIYQPAAAKTGFLLIWLNHKVYVMDIDSQEIYPVGPAPRVAAITPSPGCLGQVKAPCWVVIEDKIYQVNAPGEAATGHDLLQDDETWLNSAMSWSPDGLHVAYTVAHSLTQRSELRLYEPPTQQAERLGFDSDPTIAVAWSHDCAAGLGATCEIGYKTVVTESYDLQKNLTPTLSYLGEGVKSPPLPLNEGDVGGIKGGRVSINASPKTEISPTLVAYNPTTHSQHEWQISLEPVFELRWSPDNRLFYSRPSRHFYSAESHEAAYHVPKGATVANVSPDMAEMIYYQTFTLSDCQDANRKCVYLGLWLVKYGQNGAAQRQLIYNADLVEPVKGLNYIPTWSRLTHDLVFFQEGNLVYYDQDKNEAAIWYKSLRGKLRSNPIFAPNKQAVAFVDNQGNGVSAYRLMIINPWLQPIEKFIVAENGFQILAWLPF